MGHTGVCPGTGSATLKTGVSSLAGTWTWDCYMQIVTTGVTGTSIADGQLIALGQTGPSVQQISSTSTVTVATNSANTASLQETATLLTGQTIGLNQFWAKVDY